MGEFVDGYNHAHRHTGIGLNSPAEVQYGLAAAKAMERSGTLANARARNLKRFSSSLDPKTLTVPVSAWINNPAEGTEPKLAA